MDFRTPNASTGCLPDNANSRPVRKSSPAILRLKMLIADLDNRIQKSIPTNYFEAMDLMDQQRLLQKELQRLQPKTPGCIPKATITNAPLAETIAQANFPEFPSHVPEEADYADLQAAMFSIREVRQEISDAFTPFF